MIFKNEKQLEKFLLQKCKTAVSETEKKVFKIIDKCLKRFYNEFEPEFYIRTQNLFNSLVRTKVVPDGKYGYKAEVYFDVGRLNYVKGNVPLKKPMTTYVVSGFDVIPIRTSYGYANWDDDTILEVAMTGSWGGLPHGGWADGTAIWTDSERVIKSLGGVYRMIERELQLIGVPIVR